MLPYFFSKYKLYQISNSPFILVIIPFLEILRFVYSLYSISGDAKILGILRRAQIQAKLLYFSQQVVAKRNSTLNQTALLLSAQRGNSIPAWLPLSWKSNFPVCTRKPFPLRSSLQGGFQWWNRLSHCYF